MFSATWPKEVSTLAKEFLNEPTTIIVGSEDLVANPDVTQVVEVCAPFDRIRMLDVRPHFASLYPIFPSFFTQSILDENPESKILIFAGTKSTCDFLGEHLYENRRFYRIPCRPFSSFDLTFL
jgi:superfamily II DNA/RNA helicase